MRVDWLMVLPFGSGPFLASFLGRASFRPRRVREREAPPVARERVTEIVYISFDLYHRAISSAPPPPSLPLSRFALFFFYSLPPYFSKLPLRVVSPFRRSVSRARDGIGLTHQFASFFGDAREPYSRCLDFDISAIYCGAT